MNHEGRKEHEGKRVTRDILRKSWLGKIIIYQEIIHYYFSIFSADDY
ncbi:MAG: hypothetical protein F6K62_13680 [Sphaerospermopsis sp. SIO1G2]|nr:hypothetical protein [Sphaerospermopsis sp. SIO1G2]